MLGLGLHSSSTPVTQMYSIADFSLALRTKLHSLACVVTTLVFLNDFIRREQTAWIDWITGMTYLDANTGRLTKSRHLEHDGFARRGVSVIPFNSAISLQHIWIPACINTDHVEILDALHRHIVKMPSFLCCL